MILQIESSGQGQGSEQADPVLDEAAVDEVVGDELEQDPELESELDASGVVATYLDEIRRKLTAKGSSKIYAKKDFWIEPKPAYFCLDGAELKPDTLYHPRVFVWAPDRLVIPSKLSFHKNSEYTNFDSCSGTLHGNGYSTNPIARRIVDVDR